MREDVGAERRREPLAEFQDARAELVVLHPALELLSHRRSRCEAIVATRGERLSYDVEEPLLVGKAARLERRNVRGARELEAALRRVHSLSLDELPQEDSRGEDVASRVDVLPLRLLGAHVTG